MSVERYGGVKVNGKDPKTLSNTAHIDWYGGVDFDRNAFSAAIKDKGYDVIWEKATFCPNRVSVTSYGGLAPKDHRINCTVCDGSGFYYYDHKPTRMLMTSITLSQNYYAYGSWSSGSQMVTALPEFRLHPFDRLVLCDGRSRFQEIVRRQPGQIVDTLKYSALCVDNVVWLSRTGTVRVFRENDEFSVINGALSWSTTRPDDNDYYSVSYIYRPRYVVTELLHQHRESTIRGVHYEFPVQALAKLDFLVRDEGKDDSETDDQSPFPTNR